MRRAPGIEGVDVQTERRARRFRADLAADRVGAHFDGVEGGWRATGGGTGTNPRPVVLDVGLSRTSSRLPLK